MSHKKEVRSLPIDKGLYTPDIMVVNSDKQEEAEASNVDLELPKLELTMSNSKVVESVVQNIYSEDFLIDKGPYTPDMMVVNSDKQEEAEASNVDLELPTLELTLSKSEEMDSVVQNIYSEDFPIRESCGSLIENYGPINVNNQYNENIVEMKHEQDFNVESDEKSKVCEKEKHKFIDTFDVDEEMKCDQIKDNKEENFQDTTDGDNIPKGNVTYKKQKLKSVKPSFQCQKCFKTVKRKTTFKRHMKASNHMNVSTVALRPFKTKN